MILRTAESAIIANLTAALDAATGVPGLVDIYQSDEDERKRPMPYIIVQCVESEEQITPGSGIFKVQGTIEYRSHTKETDPEYRQLILNAINQFAYGTTAENLSKANRFHCHGWQPMDARMTVDNDRKATIYALNYNIFCMELDESGDPPL